LWLRWSFWLLAPPDTKKTLTTPLIRDAQIQGASSPVIQNSVRWPPNIFSIIIAIHFPKHANNVHRSTFTETKAVTTVKFKGHCRIMGPQNGICSCSWVTSVNLWPTLFAMNTKQWQFPYQNLSK
jgi:hypothetical protein